MEKIKGKEMTFDIFPNMRLSFPDFMSLQNYIQNEIKFWNNVDSSITQTYQELLESLPKSEKSLSEQEVNNYISTIRNMLINGSIDNSRIHLCINSQSLLAQYLKNLHDKTPDEYQDVASAIITLNFGRKNADLCLGNRVMVENELFRKLLQSYFLFNSGAITNIDLSNYREKLKTLLSDITQTNIDTKNELAQNKKTFESSINTDQKIFQELCDTISQKKKAFEDTFENRLQTWNQNIDALEKTYNEKLQLEAPAEYWQKLASKYRKEGGIYIVADIVVGALFAFILFLLLIHSDWIPVFNREKFDLNVVRGCLLLLAMSSILGFIIHILTKFAFSSYHLARDYEERFQLTKVYLALLKNDSIKDNEQVKSIVMQSLFCRADTGLLKGEHSSQMPSPITDILKDNVK